jgi:hypothetical protein
MNYVLTISENDLRLLDNALGLRPYVEIADLIRRLGAQVNAQVQAANNPPVEEVKPPVEEVKSDGDNK